MSIQFGSRIPTFVFATVALCASHSFAAKPLSNLMPGPTVVYVEWAGADAVAAAQADTPFGRLAADPGVARLIDEAKRSLEIIITGQAAAGGDAQTAEAAMRVLGTLWRQPLALDVLGLVMTEAGPSLEAVLAVDVGDADAQAFMAAIETLLTNALHLPPAAPEQVGKHAFKRFDLPFVPAVRYGTVGERFILTVGQATTDKVLSTINGNAETVDRDPSLAAGMKKIGVTGRDTLSIVHLNTAAALDQARAFWSAMNAVNPPALPQEFESVLDAASLTRLTAITGLWQIDGDAYRETWFVAIPPKNGTPKWMNQKPITNADIAMVPADATFAKIANFRVRDLYDGLLHVADAVGPPAQTKIANAIATVDGVLGLRIKDDILDVLDDGWVWYISPSSGGFLLTGLTGLIEVKDAQRAIDLIERLVRHIDKTVGPGVVGLGRTRYKDKDIGYVSVTGAPVPIAPAWTVHKRHIVVGLHPQTVMRAIDHLTETQSARSLLDNPDFVRARKAVPRECTGIVYSDTKSAVTQLYRLALPAMTALTSWARGNGVPAATPALLPTLDTVTSGLFGDIIAVSSDSDGMLFVTHGPWPASGYFTATPVITAALGTSVLVPSLARARELSKRVVSASNARAIVGACRAYAEDHDGRFPPDLETLMNRGDIDRSVLRSPRDDGNGMSYLYVSGRTLESDGDAVVLYEKPDIGTRDGSAVGFVDGRAEWLADDDVKKVLRKDEQRLRVPRRESRP